MLFKDFIFNYGCANMCACGCMWPQRPDVLELSGAEVIGGYELPNAGVGNTWVPWKQNARLTAADPPLQSQPFNFTVECNI